MEWGGTHFFLTLGVRPADPELRVRQEEYDG
jgi:hypothetical protein